MRTVTANPYEKDDALAQRTFERAKGYTGREVTRKYKGAVGVEPLITADTRGLAEGFVQENVALIRDLPAKQLTQIEEEVIEAIARGERAGALSKIIRARSGVAKKRADLIARDQMGKAVSQLNQKRQQDLGVDRYIWRTAGDERVRPEHVARNGETFSWSDSPPDGHPGEPINCRCTAEPVLTDILDSLGVDYNAGDFNRSDPVEWDLQRKKAFGGTDGSNWFSPNIKFEEPKTVQGSKWPYEHEGFSGAGRAPDELSVEDRPAPNRIHLGVSSNREFDMSLNALPIEPLPMKGVQITREGIDAVKRHIRRFERFEPNEGMVDRLQKIEAGELQISDYDVRFYTHKLHKLERYKAAGWESGEPENANEFWLSNHVSTLEDYGVNELTHPLYHPETRYAKD